MPIVPGIADGWMVDWHDLHLCAIIECIVAALVDVAIHYDVIVPRPPLSCWHTAPKARAPHNDILRAVFWPDEEIVQRCVAQLP